MKRQGRLHHEEVRRRGDAFVGSIEAATERNKAFRRVLYTGPKMQLVLMSLRPREEIGLEVHPHTDQFFRIEKGRGILVAGSRRARLGPGDAVLVPAGTKHNVINSSDRDRLQLYTLYAPPKHPPEKRYLGRDPGSVPPAPESGVRLVRRRQVRRKAGAGKRGHSVVDYEGVRYYPFVIRYTTDDGARHTKVLYSPGAPWTREVISRHLDAEGAVLMPETSVHGRWLPRRE